MSTRRAERGQGLVEMAIMLPVLLLLLVGIAEVGHALRDYIIVVNADREGCRYAARGRYSDIIERTLTSSGYVVVEGETASFLRTDGPGANAAVIVTTAIISPTGTLISYTQEVSGVIFSGYGESTVVRDVDPVVDSRYSQAEIISKHGDSTKDINTKRTGSFYEPMPNHIVIVEVFYAHRPLLGGLVIPSPVQMYADTGMRVVTGR